MFSLLKPLLTLPSSLHSHLLLQSSCYTTHSHGEGVGVGVGGGGTVGRENRHLITALTKKLSIKHPIIQAPLAEVALGKLAGTVSRVGGIGFLGVGSSKRMSPQKLESEWKIAQQISPSGAIGCGFIVRLLDDKWNDKSFLKCLELTPKPKSVWLSFGDDYKPYVEKIKEKSITVIIMAHSVKEAILAQKYADIIVVQGSDAGGHLKNLASLITLLPETRDALRGSGIPLVAAGGIVDGRGLAAALVLGADGVAMGTRMVATSECASSPSIKHQIITETDGGITTTATHIFDYLASLDWGNDVFGRALKSSSTLKKYHNFLNDRKFAPTEEDKKWYIDNKDNSDVRPVWCGTGCGMIHSVVSAEQVIVETVDLAVKILNREESHVVVG